MGKVGLDLNSNLLKGKLSQSTSRARCATSFWIPFFAFVLFCEPSSSSLSDQIFYHELCYLECRVKHSKGRLRWEMMGLVGAVEMVPSWMYCKMLDINRFVWVTFRRKDPHIVFILNAAHLFQQSLRVLKTSWRPPALVKVWRERGRRERVRSSCRMTETRFWRARLRTSSSWRAGGTVWSSSCLLRSARRQCIHSSATLSVCPGARKRHCCSEQIRTAVILISLF